MSNQKGNGIEAIQRNLSELGLKYQKLIQINKQSNLKISDLLEKDERSTAEISRLKKLTSDYGTICKDCNRGTDNQLKLTKANRHLKTWNNWQCIALGIAAITIMLLLRGN